MNRLESFLAILRGQDIDATCNWQMKRGNGFVEHYTMRDGQRICTVIINDFGDNKGFEVYLNTGNDYFAQDIEAIKNQLNADV